MCKIALPYYSTRFLNSGNTTTPRLVCCTQGPHLHSYDTQEPSGTATPSAAAAQNSALHQHCACCTCSAAQPSGAGPNVLQRGCCCGAQPWALGFGPICGTSGVALHPPMVGCAPSGQATAIHCVGHTTHAGGEWA